MENIGAWLRFVLAALATWRLSHLIAFEDGPWDVIVRIRRWAGSGFWGRLLDCFYCVSLWVSAGMVALLRPTLQDVPLLWLGLSGAACLLDRLGGDRVRIHAVEEEGGSANAVLRTESGEDPESNGRRHSASGAG